MNFQSWNWCDLPLYMRCAILIILHSRGKKLLQEKWYNNQKLNLMSCQWKDLRIRLLATEGFQKADSENYGIGTRSRLPNFQQSTMETKSLTLYIPQQFLLTNICSFKCFANLFLPQGYKLIEWNSILRGSNIENLIQGYWIINSFDSIGSDIFFLIENSCIKKELVDALEKENWLMSQRFLWSFF